MLGGLGWIISAMVIVSGRFGCPRFQSGAPQARSCWEAFSTAHVFGVLTQSTQHVGASELWITNIRSAIVSVFGVGIFNRFHLLTRFLKSAVTSLVNTARLRKPVDTSLLSWVRWLFPKFSRTSMYCSLFSTWAGEKKTHTHTGKMSTSRELNLKRNVQII